MKILSIGICLLACSLLSCRDDHAANDTLDRAEALFQSAPDSTYALLNQIENEQTEVDIIDAEKRHKAFSVIKQNKRLRFYTFLSVTTSVILCLCLVLLYQYRDRKRLYKINRQQRLLDENERLLARLREEIRPNTSTAANNEETQLLREKIAQTQREIIALKCDKLPYSTLFKELKERGNYNRKNEKQALSEQDWTDIRVLVDSACPKWQASLQDDSILLTQSEIETCYLSFLDLSLKQEAILLNISMASANKRRARTRKKLNLVNMKQTIHCFLIEKAQEYISR